MGVSVKSTRILTAVHVVPGTIWSWDLVAIVFTQRNLARGEMEDVEGLSLGALINRNCLAQCLRETGRGFPRYQQYGPLVIALVGVLYTSARCIFTNYLPTEPRIISISLIYRVRRILCIYTRTSYWSITWSMGMIL